MPRAGLQGECERRVMRNLHTSAFKDVPITLPLSRFAHMFKAAHHYEEAKGAKEPCWRRKTRWEA